MINSHLQDSHSWSEVYLDTQVYVWIIQRYLHIDVISFSRSHKSFIAICFICCYRYGKQFELIQTYKPANSMEEKSLWNRCVMVYQDYTVNVKKVFPWKPQIWPCSSQHTSARRTAKTAKRTQLTHRSVSRLIFPSSHWDNL